MDQRPEMLSMRQRWISDAGLSRGPWQLGGQNLCAPRQVAESKQANQTVPTSQLIKRKEPSGSFCSLFLVVLFLLGTEGFQSSDFCSEISQHQADPYGPFLK